MIEKLSKHLFWDYNRDKLDQDADANWLVERVFMRGYESDEREIFKYYGKDKIREIAMNARYFDKVTLNYLSIILETPKEEFRCYEKSQLPTPFGICC